MKKQVRALAFGLAVGLAAAGTANASGTFSESIGVDAYYVSGDHADAWAGSISYARIVASNFEVGVAYSFAGTDPGDGTVQGLQLLGRQWFGLYPRANTITPFVELAAGLEFADGKYENTIGAGLGLGVFVTDQTELRVSLRQTWGGFEDTTRMNVGFFYHF